MSGLRTVSMFKCCELGISVRRPSHSCFLFVPSVLLCVGVCVFRVVVSYLPRDCPYCPPIMPLKSRANVITLHLLVMLIMPGEPSNRYRD